MKKVILAVVLSVVALEASARESIQNFSLENAMQREDFKSRLGDDIKLYFGETAHPEVTRKVGQVSTSKKTNAFNKSDRVACEWALLSALISLQEQARQSGANAVVNIESNYKHNRYSSTNEFQCGAGNVIAGVALTGSTVVTQ
ncbi:excinuclease ABC subunit A [Microbulbifer bruguierae]|uniref:Excinuclease ABC subunit A n=1 Tax=Microbulbifer bruguierae TaxID=3029061 RepID=A0ABY8N8Z7_9GAMM|nr:excinuclease ABC subunit A [Microbulbifer bruguierae]WGL15268.1 excinuclease ABC subunit A [Microbulbifer bruguierae]